MTTDSQKRQIARDFGINNVGDAFNAAERAGLPFSVACALLEKESSGGRNVYGNDAGGALAGYPHPVNVENYKVFHWLVFDKGQQSNGVGPCQITYKGFFEQMEEQGLSPWLPRDNMLFGFRLLAGHKKQAGTWEAAGTRYNGSPAYGADLANKIEKWVERFR